MSDPIINQFCQTFADNLCDGRGDATAAACRPPLAVYHAGYVTLHVSEKEVEQAMLSWATAARLIGTARIDVTLTGSQTLKDGRVSVVAEWLYLDAAGATVTATALTCFIGPDGDGGHEIEMLEILEMGFDGYPPFTPGADRPN